MFLARLSLLIMMALTTLSGLGQQAPAPAPADAIAKIRDQWSKDLHDKRLDDIVTLYAPDATFLTPNGERVTGRDAIRTLTKQAMASFTSDLSFQSIAFASSGTLAYDEGQFRETLTNTANGSVSHNSGSYLMVFKRQTDGNWLIAEQAWVAAPISVNPN
jgi:uncharacterized protein (TIGR02246 family)